MLDLKFIKENIDLIKNNLKKKFQTDKIALVDSIIKKHQEWIQAKKELDQTRALRNKLSQEINQLKKQKKDISRHLDQAKNIPSLIDDLEKRSSLLLEEIESIQKKIPNIIHTSVPIGKDETKNKVIKKSGAIPKFKFEIKNHVELIEALGIGDFDSSALVAGKGFYYLKGKLGLLNQALIRFAIDFMQKKKYTYIEPPLMVNKEIASAAGDLKAFELALYKIEGEELYLIPTAEHALLGMLSNKVINEKELPLKFFGYSMSFRKEIGSHGINEKGLWRTHQFNKVEQFIFCKPEDSHKYYLELRKNSEEIFQKLKLPYRILESCTGDLSDWKSKGEDIEVYRPTTKKYEEVGSLSNCTSYQARELNIRVLKRNGEKRILHTLNNTALATSRVMVAILENYQQKDGSIKIPAVLQKYIGFKKIEK